MRSIVYLLGVIAAAILPAAGLELEDGFDLRRLSDDTFQPLTSKGLWLVEHFSPRCSHCKAFAPTWEQLARENKHLERLTGFHLAQVDCLAQGDLCNSNGIKFYPQIMLYKDGKLVEQYNNDRSYESLTGYIEDQSIAYARGEPLPAEQSETDTEGSDNAHKGAVRSVGRPNPEGKVIAADEARLEEIINAGPAFVEFFAPWCSHCKKLRPTYEKLAAAFRNKLNVVAVDCVANAILCKKKNVMSYPTLRKYQSGEMTEYTGARSLEALKTAALSLVTQNGLPSIQHEDFNATVYAEDAFLLYLTNFDTTASERTLATQALEKVSNIIPSFTSSDPLLYANLSIANPPPTSLLLAFSSQSPKPVASISFPCTSTDLEKFINLHRYPTLMPLTAANYAEIFKSPLDPIVVLGALHTTAKDQRVRLEKAARAWQRGGRDLERAVWFVWVDGQKWGSWMKRAYGIKKASLPTAVIISPSTGEYYDHTIEGEPIELEGASIFAALEGVFQKVLKPKRSRVALKWGNSPSIFTPTGLMFFSGEHPIIALIIVLGAVAAVLLRMRRNRSRDTRGGLPGPYGNPYAEKYSPSGNRLD